jgi:protein O-GlcNAc transferase
MSRASTTDLLAEALALHRQGATAQAIARYSAVLDAEPGNADAYYHLGVIACQEGRFAEGAAFAGKALAGNARHERAHVLLGRALSALGCDDEAVSSFTRAIALAPDFAQAHSHLADLLSDLGRNPEAIDSYDRALALAPDAVADWFNRGLALRALGRREEALSSFDRAIAGKLDFAKAHLQRANALWELHRPDQALDGVDKALAIEPQLAEAWHSRGIVLSALGRCDEAFAAYDKALSLQPVLAEAWLGRGNISRQLKRYDAAFVAYDRALALKADLAAAWLGRGNALFELRRYDEALAAYDRAFALKPQSTVTAGARLNVKLLMCDWTNFDAELADLLAKIKARSLQSEAGGGAIEMEEAVSPMVMARLTDDPAILLASAVGWVKEHAAYGTAFTHAGRPHAGKLRLGYVSQDFRHHVTGTNVVDLFENHDRQRFEVFGFSLTPDDGSAIRMRLTAAFDQFHDLSGLGDEAAARRIYDLGVDVLVEIAPHTDGSRPAIFAYRPAPVQINGFTPGYSTGASFIDYVVSDKWMLPMTEQPFYREKIVHIPHTCFAHDSTQVISARIPERSEEGLPDRGFVFCCFNTSYKISRRFFQAWMRLLRGVDGSVLWLSGQGAVMAENLRREAANSGIDPARLVFAERLPAMADHLGRHRLADLFLDTLPYNAQTTAMDALWAGVPVLTCTGRSYAGRSAMSQLYNIGLPELVAEDLAAYERLALALARDPQRLQELRAKLERNRLITPLFDTKRLCRELESAYSTMVEIWQCGESPRSFSVEPA